MSSSPRRNLIFDFLAPPLVILTAFVSFVNRYDYSYAAAEIWISLVGLIALGLLCGVVMLGGHWLRIVVTAGLVILFVDFQSNWLEQHPALRMPGLGVGVVFLCWLVRDHLSLIATSIFGTMLAVTLMVPGASGGASFDHREPQHRSAQETSKPAPPVLVHVIFDEFIGIEGISTEISNGTAVRDLLRSFFLTNGFYVFGRAYSRFVNTRNAIPGTLNYASPPEDSHFTVGGAPRRLRENRYFKEMHEQGYDLHLYQTDYMDFCTGYEIQVKSCVSFMTSIAPLEDLPLPALDKAKIVLESFTRLSLAQRAFGTFYTLLRREARRRGYELPPWPTSKSNMAPTRGVRDLDAIAQEVAKAPTGELYFVHLLFPHHPYTYDRRCQLRDPDDWDTIREDAPLPPNSAQSRARRYALYFEQVLCVQAKLQEMFDGWRRAGIYDRMKIIIHGDHGSRIFMNDPTVANKHRLVTSDYVDAFSTLFAIKAPSLEPAYDTHMVAIQDLLEAVARGQPLAQVPTDGTRPFVFLRNGLDMVRQPLPDFGDASLEERRLRLSQP
jgi:hypothetical protein